MTNKLKNTILRNILEEPIKIVDRLEENRAKDKCSRDKNALMGEMSDDRR